MTANNDILDVQHLQITFAGAEPFRAGVTFDRSHWCLSLGASGGCIRIVGDGAADVTGPAPKIGVDPWKAGDSRATALRILAAAA